MRILVNGLGRDIQPTGVCRVAANHIRALLTNRVGDEVVLVIGSWQQELFRLLLGDQSHLVEFVIVDIKNSSLARNLWFAASLPRIAKEHNVHLVHHSFPVPVIRSAFHCPVIVTVHDFYPYDIPENFGFPNYYGNRLILRQCIRNIDGIACVSNATRSRLDELFPNISRRVPVVVTGNYVRMSDDVSIPPAIATELAGSPFLLSVAQHRKNKNLDLLLLGYRELINRGVTSFPLLIVGSKGPETPTLTGLVENLGIRDRVKFVHSISDSELGWLYSNSSVVVLCSSIEGYCLPVAEALASHAKIVCSDIDILREIAGDHGVYFSLYGDADRNLADAIVSALGNNVPAAPLDERFAEGNILARYYELYARVLSPLEDGSTEPLLT